MPDGVAKLVRQLVRQRFATGTVQEYRYLHAPKYRHDGGIVIDPADDLSRGDWFFQSAARLVPSNPAAN